MMAFLHLYPHELMAEFINMHDEGNSPMFHVHVLTLCLVPCLFRMLPGPLKDAVEVWSWKKCYSMQEVNSALSKVQLVGYSQKVVRPTPHIGSLSPETFTLSSPRSMHAFNFK